MKKLLGIVVLGLLWFSILNAEDKKPVNIFNDNFEVYVKSDDFIILTIKEGVAHRIQYQNYGSKIPKTAFDHCNSKGKKAHLIGYEFSNGGIYVDEWYGAGFGFSRKMQTRFICAEDRANANKVFQKYIGNKKLLGKKFYSSIENCYHRCGSALEYDLYDDLVLIEQNYQEVKIAEKPKKEKPKKEQPKASPDDDKIVPAGSGSGFFVSKDGHVITNYHVIEGCDINKLSFKGSQTEVKILAVDKVNDIAILKSNTKPDVIFPVSNEDVSLLEDVIVAGFPLGKQISSAIKTHKGVVTALAGAGDNYSFFQTDAAINQGNSGGPIINQKGNVVGIAVATWVEEGVQGVHFGIKSSTLKTFASANGLSFASPNYRELSNKDLGKLITKGTVYVECHMTVAKIKKMIAQAENRKAFFKEHK